MWYVLYTKPRSEKKTAALIAQKKIQVYCPLQETVRQWSDRKKKIQEPLFKSYIFIYLQDYEKQQFTVLNTPGSVRFLWWMGKPAIVKDYEISIVKQFLNEYKDAVVSVFFEQGDEVTVREGILKEQQASIIKIKGNKAFLQLKSLGWNIKAEVPLQTLELKVDD